MLRLRVLAPLLFLPLLTAHCSDDEVTATPTSDGGADAMPVDDKDGSAPAPASGAKVDLLFVVDNSAAMADKQAILARSLRALFAPLEKADVHVGVISSSISDGGDVCPRTEPRTDDKARLLNLAPGTTAVVAGAERGFLSFGSADATIPSLTALEERTAEILRGVGESGCGIEAPLEAMYRFVAQPDPPLRVELDSFQQAQYAGVDYVLLAQRKAFFRPDSAVAIIMLTDEEDASIDPLAVGGFGYAFSSRNFPGSNVARGSAAQGRTAPRPTSVCATTPTSPDCTSCGFSTTCDPNLAACQKIKNDPNCQTSPVAGQSGPGFDGFYAATKDDLNVRMHDMKRRYGVEPRYPIGRYVAALGGAKLPDRAAEHPTVNTASGVRQIAEYVQATTCANPLFSAGLPEKEGDPLCDLTPNGRDPKKVFFGLLGGVPAPLVATATPDWTKILGRDPATYDLGGIDAHMLLSIEPRAGLDGADLPRGDNGTDPIHGREWRTNDRDLQFACTFALPTPRLCDGATLGCQCAAEDTTNPPVCGGAGNTTQIRGRAYPTARELHLVKELGAQAIAGSICDLDASGSYTAFSGGVAQRLAGALAK